jgi:hypothetical protein
MTERDDLIQQGKELVARDGATRLELGDLFAEAILAGFGKQEFATAIGMDAYLLDYYMTVSFSWPKETRPRVAWSVLYEARNDPERHERVVDGLTVDEYRGARRQGRLTRSEATATARGQDQVRAGVGLEPRLGLGPPGP